MECNGIRLGCVLRTTTNGTGFTLDINAQNQWQFTIGNGAAATVVNTMVPAAVNNTLTYVAVTFVSASPSAQPLDKPG